jgi:thioredoxin reductase (NADPH)
MTPSSAMEDVLIVGAGPAGLTAAIYLSRFHLSVAVVDAGHSRAALIPRTHNHAGYPGGIRGVELLRLMREQAGEFGVQVRPGVVERLRARR